MRTLWSLVLLVFVFGPSPRAEAKGEPRLALLPVGGVNVPAATGQRLFSLLQRELRRRRLRAFGVGVVPPAECDDPCMVGIGRRAGARRLLRLEVGGLGSTFVLRLTIYDVLKGARQGSWQEVLGSLDDKLIEPALSRMINGFAPPPPLVTSKPWYKRWWVWAIAAGVVATGTILAVTLSSDSGPDHVVVPPGP